MIFNQIFTHFLMFGGERKNIKEISVEIHSDIALQAPSIFLSNNEKFHQDIIIMILDVV